MLRALFFSLGVLGGVARGIADLEAELEASRRDLAGARAEIAELRRLVAVEGCASCCPQRPPTSGARSLYVDKDDVVDFAARDLQGGAQQKGKVLSVDDVLFGYDALYEHRQLFRMQRWKGMLIEQDPSDAFAIADFLWTTRPDVLIEFGTYTGGSAVFFAEVMTAYNPKAHVITIDVKQHPDPGQVKSRLSPLWGSTIRSIIGHPATREVRMQVDALLMEFNATNVFLNEDSYHIYEEVLAHLQGYHDLVRPCGWILVQDTRLSRLHGTGGPIKAQRTFLSQHPYFAVRRDFEYLLYTQHPQGWMQRRARGRPCPDLGLRERMA